MKPPPPAGPLSNPGSVLAARRDSYLDSALVEITRRSGALAEEAPPPLVPNVSCAARSEGEGSLSYAEHVLLGRPLHTRR